MKRRGLTLIEVLFTCFLGALVLAAAALLTRRAADLTATQQVVDQTVESGRTGLERIAREIRGCLAVESPATGASSVLRLRVHQVSRGDWLPDTVPTPLPAEWTPQAARVISVSADGQGLLLLQDGARTEILASEVLGFQCESLEHAVLLKLQVRSARHSRALSLLATRRIEP